MIFFTDFSQNIRNNALIFCGCGRKRQMFANFEKICEIVFKNFLKKIVKNALF